MAQMRSSPSDVCNLTGQSKESFSRREHQEVMEAAAASVRLMISSLGTHGGPVIFIDGNRSSHGGTLEKDCHVELFRSMSVIKHGCYQRQLQCYSGLGTRSYSNHRSRKASWVIISVSFVYVLRNIVFGCQGHRLWVGGCSAPNNEANRQPPPPVRTPPWLIGHSTRVSSQWKPRCGADKNSKTGSPACVCSLPLGLLTLRERKAFFAHIS